MAIPDKIAVIGAGTMGNGIVQTFAAYGAQVTMIDVSAPALEKGLATIKKSLARFADKEGPPGFLFWRKYCAESPEFSIGDVMATAGGQNDPALRAAYNACLPKLSDYGTEMGQNEKLFAAYQAVAANPANSPRT